MLQVSTSAHCNWQGCFLNYAFIFGLLWTHEMDYENGTGAGGVGRILFGIVVKVIEAVTEGRWVGGKSCFLVISVG